MLAQAALQNEQLGPVFLWAERDRRARLILDNDMKIGWINNAAVQLVNEITLLDILHDRLVVKDGKWAISFSVFVRSATAKVSMLCIPLSSGAHLVCTAIGLGSETASHAIGMTLRCTDRVAPFDGAALETAFNLTSAERRVVEALFAGHTAEEAGASLCVSIGTVRAHIRHIYGKMNVSSREALFHKLLSFLTYS